MKSQHLQMETRSNTVTPGQPKQQISAGEDTATWTDFKLTKNGEALPDKSLAFFCLAYQMPFSHLVKLTTEEKIIFDNFVYLQLVFDVIIN